MLPAPLGDMRPSYLLLPLLAAGCTEAVSQEVGAAVAHGVTTGGKRLRPILCVSAYRAAGGEEVVVARRDHEAYAQGAGNAFKTFHLSLSV